ncbi:endonuclease/exonuclease/phosphatase family protein [Actinoplanes sp. NPDC051411]|uniref:endonuclease/exonuclease/phosphatase family protein n=1 Tax=Actinoplanes sp. NPDC051411 TaxID=3155522 RepID=UPI003436A86F
MRKVFTFFLAALVALVTLSAAGPARADTPDPANWPKPRFLSYNVCGAAGQCGIYQNSATAWSNTMISAIDNWDADLIMLQEVCYGQWTTLRAALQNRTSGSPYDSIWGASLASTNGCKKWGSDLRYGLVILAKGGAGTINNSYREVTYLPNPSGGEARILLCGRASVTGRLVRACDTHIDYVGSDPQQQVAAVAAKTRGYTEPVVLGGDFNLEPQDARLNPIYDHSGGTGVFQEVDENDTSYFTAGCAGLDRCRSGEPTETVTPDCQGSGSVTHTAKIDYIFVSAAFFTTVRGDAAACTVGMSDHHLLRGAAAWVS